MDSESLSDACVFPSLNSAVSQQGEWENLEIPDSLTRQISEASHRLSLRPSTLLSALWSVLLCQYMETRVSKIWLGNISAEPVTETAELKAVSLHENPTFKALLQPESWSGVASDSEHASNTGILVIEQFEEGDSNVGLEKDRFDGLITTTGHRLYQACDVLVKLRIHPTKPSLCLSYRTTTLSDFHASSLLDMFQQLAKSVIKDPAQRINQLSFITQQDINRIRTWNSRDLQQTDCSMHHLIHKRAIDHPHTVAVDAWDGVLSYAELDRLSSQMAIELIQHGIGAGVFVPLCFEKSFWAIVATLAVNKSGGAFVPLDPAIPVQRLSNIIEQTSADLVLASESQAPSLRAMGYRVLTPSELTLEPGVNKMVFPHTLTHPTSPAYCLFTSGSTGIPKGCVVDQSAFAGIAYHAPKLHIRPATRVLQFASLSFGISLIEVFCSLSAGGTLCIPSTEDRLNSLAEAIATMNIAWAILTPSALDSISSDDVESLKTIVLAGEAVKPAQVTLWAGKVKLFQAYGCTEWAGIFSISDQVTSPAEIEQNIGFPVNGRAWLVDPNERTRLQPIGALAELMIEGPNLANGYLNDPKKTSAAFSLPPFGMRGVTEVDGIHNRRLYTTGDLVRYNMDGSICHMGRKDNQIKIRGQRVEVAEVESHLRRALPHAKEIVVDRVVPTASNGIPSLAAFILQKQATASVDGNGIASVLGEPSSQFLDLAKSTREELMNHLPSYMIPTTFLPLRQSPRTLTGKTDRLRLRNEVASIPWDQWREYTTDGKRGDEEDKTPTSATEKMIAKIWGQLFHLDTKKIKLDDDFFALGGDSIIAMRLVAIARGMGITISIIDMFSSPQLRDLAQKATLSADSGIDSGASTFSDGERDDEGYVDSDIRDICISSVCKPDTPLADAEVIAVFPVTDSQLYYMTQYGFEHWTFMLEGDVDIDRMQDACRAVVQRHSGLRSIFTQNEHGIFQVVLQHVEISLHHITTSERFSDVCESICETKECLQTHLDHLAVRFILVTDCNGDQALILRMSHAQYDGFSFKVLLNDFAMAYEGKPLLSGGQFTDYIHYRSERNAKPAYDFWREYLQGSQITPFPSFPPNRDGALPTIFFLTTTLAPLPKPPTGITLATLAKASWALVFAQLSKRTDVVFGQIVSGRNIPLPDIENILGICVNFTPIRLNLQPTWTVAQYLDHVQKEHFESMRHEDLNVSQIFENSTPWGSDAYFPCVIQHHNLSTQHRIPFQTISSTSSQPAFKARRERETRIVTVPFPDHLLLKITPSLGTMSEEQASSILERWKGTIQTLENYPNLSLPEALTASGGSPLWYN